MNVRIGVFSDTHGDTSCIKPYKSVLGKLDAIFHLGDFCRDAESISRLFNCPFYAVRGNCDSFSSEPQEQVIELGGKRFLLTHGHKYWSEYELCESAVKNCCDAVFYGHSHTPSLRAQGRILICNPGSPSRPRYGSEQSCALVLIEDGELNIKMLSSSSLLSGLL